MANNKKYYYSVGLFAEGESTGYILVTKAEAEVIAKYTKTDSWVHANLEGWCGGFGIDIENPIPEEEFESYLEKLYNGG